MKVFPRCLDSIELGCGTDILFYIFSLAVRPCQPLRKDPDLDYDVDSDEEWEEVLRDSL